MYSIDFQHFFEIDVEQIFYILLSLDFCDEISIPPIWEFIYLSNRTRKKNTGIERNKSATVGKKILK